MRILYYDCFAGISGDMNLASMIDLGVEADFIQGELSKLGLDDEFELQVKKGKKMDISGTIVTVVLKKAGETVHHHSHRNLADITRVVNGSNLDPKVKKTSLDIFQELAFAEARVHGKSVEEIHFHEVGATDAIVDIVGAAICYHKLEVDSVLARPVELGRGFVRCMHGTMPVPAPATAEILKGFPVTMGTVTCEATTPTGAAIIKTVADAFASQAEFTISKIGYGIGHREIELPNVLRVIAGDMKN